MTPVILRVLIVEDSADRQRILCSLFRDHAWVMVHTAARAIRLLRAYDFDLVSLDYDLAGPERGDKIAAAILQSRNATVNVLVHAMNTRGADRISQFLPRATLMPVSKIIRNNATFKRLRHELQCGSNIDWAFVLTDVRKGIL